MKPGREPGLSGSANTVVEEENQNNLRPLWPGLTPRLSCLNLHTK